MTSKNYERILDLLDHATQQTYEPAAMIDWACCWRCEAADPSTPAGLCTACTETLTAEHDPAPEADLVLVSIDPDGIRDALARMGAMMTRSWESMGEGLRDAFARMALTLGVEDVPQVDGSDGSGYSRGYNHRNDESR